MGSFFGNLVESVLERVGRLADGWMPQFPPDDDLAAALDRLRGYAVAAGRDPDQLGIECVMRIRADDDPQRWHDDASAYRALGATHLKVATSGRFESLDDLRDCVVRWYEVARTV